MVVMTSCGSITKYIQCNGANELSTNEEPPNLRLHNRAKNLRQDLFFHPSKTEKVIAIITYCSANVSGNISTQ